MMDTLALVPWPRRVKRGAGSCELRGRTLRIAPDVEASPAVRSRLLALGLERRVDRALPARTAVLGEPPRVPAPPDREQGYGLVATPAGLALSGRDAEGFFWGLVTLEQLLDGGSRVPAVSISDWPEIALRGHHDDVSRKQVSTLADFRRIIGHLRRYKINVYTPYLEDMLHLASHPDVGEGRGKLTPDEVRAIVREGELNGVMVMPTFSLIGHYENLLRLPRYRALGRAVFQEPSSLDPANPAVRAFLKQVIGEVCALFPAPFFHMGFDETQGVGKEDFLSHANFCAREVVRHGKRPVMWVDMIYNHFGYETVRQLHPAIIPVDWQYGDVSRRLPHWKELRAQGREVWGLAGYGNWGCFLPDSAKTKRHFAGWMKQLRRAPTRALFASMWGDNGYENSRDLSWNLFAAFGEAAWSGAKADAASLDGRFQRTFYGASLPRLERVMGELPASLSLPPGAWWRLHRKRAVSMLRYAAANRPLWRRVARDEERLRAALKDVAASRRQARREASHLDHVEVSLRRMLSVAHRFLAAAESARAGRARLPAAAVDRITRELAATRDLYTRAWLRHNKRENIDVSRDVFDAVADSYLDMVREPPSPRRGCFVPFELGPLCNRNHLDIGGVPVGPAVIHGVPFLFAEVNRTHVSVQGKGESVRLRMAPALMRDLHLIAALTRPADSAVKPALRVEWLRRGRAVFTEDLLAIRHLVDWWGVLGEHMWAGGGQKYSDPTRVQLALLPDEFYGLSRIANFPITGTPVVDEVRLTLLGDETLSLFAATAEVLPNLEG